MQIYQDNIAARLAGNTLQPLSGVSITVTDDATNLPASLYSDNGVTPLAQPLTTNADGYFSFAAADGSYTLTFTSPRIATFTRKVILEDPTDDPYATKTELAAVSGAELIGFRRSFDNQVMTVAQALDDATVENADVVRGTLLTGLDLAVNAAVTAADTILSAFGKIQKAITDHLAAKDAAGGYAGLTALKINFKNVANTFTSFLTNTNTAARTYTFPDKDGTVAMTSDLPAASAVSLITSVTVGSAVANIDFLTTFTSAYDKYIIEVQGVTASASQALRMRLANAGVVDTATNYSSMVGPNTNSTAAQAHLDISNGLNLSDSLTMTLEILNINATSRKPVKAAGFMSGYNIDLIGCYTAANAASGFRLYWSAGANFTAGTVRVYGVKNT